MIHLLPTHGQAHRHPTHPGKGRTLTVAPSSAAVPVDPAHFVSSMTKHWQERFPTAVSPTLQETWRLLATVFNERVTSSGTPAARRWKAVPAPTGTGKSQGLAVYCSLLSEVNHPG